MMAPMVLAGPINRLAFQAYVEQVLVPELSPGDIKATGRRLEEPRETHNQDANNAGCECEHRVQAAFSAFSRSLAIATSAHP